MGKYPSILLNDRASVKGAITDQNLRQAYEWTGFRKLGGDLRIVWVTVFSFVTEGDV